MSNNNFDNVLLQLNQIKQSTFVECWVPSLDKNEQFKPMSVAQQQDVIRVIASKNKASTIKALNVINKMIEENAKDLQCELNVVDRDAVLLQMKANDASTTKQELDAIIQVVDKVKSNKKLIKQSNSINKYGIVVHMSLPSLHKDTSTNDAFAVKLEAKEVADALASFYNMQIIKFVSKIVVGDETVEFNDISNAEQYVKIIENLPTDINNAVLIYANEMQNLFSDALKQFNINLQTLPNI
jgi:hypothetical protein